MKREGDDFAEAVHELLETHKNRIILDHEYIAIWRTFAAMMFVTSNVGFMLNRPVVGIVNFLLFLFGCYKHYKNTKQVLEPVITLKKA